MSELPEPESIDNTAVYGVLHRTAAAPVAALALTHGAGGNCHTPLLVAVAEHFAAHGIAVLRYDMPFRRRRPKGPPSPSAAGVDRDGVRAAISAVRSLTGSPKILAGGISYGGRQTTMVAAEEAGAADDTATDGLLLFSYPLHPPGKPDRLRTEHFPELRTPAVFVQGGNDPFGRPDEVADALVRIPATTTLVRIDGGAHDLSKNKFHTPEVALSAVQEAFALH